jgi:heme/copper-type cytochrome/quinol oxidase subunit 2
MNQNQEGTARAEGWHEDSVSQTSAVLWLLFLVLLAIAAAAATYLLINLPPRQAAPAIPSDIKRSIFWYWFIASFVAVYVFLLLFVLEEEEG